MPILVRPDNTRSSVKVSTLEEASKLLGSQTEFFYNYEGEAIAIIDANSKYSDKPINKPIMEYICKKMNRNMNSIDLIRGNAVAIISAVI